MGANVLGLLGLEVNGILPCEHIWVYSQHTNSFLGNVLIVNMITSVQSTYAGLGHKDESK